MESTTLTLLSVFGGASLTALAGLVGAWIQAHREHRRWVRERRYDAFVKAQAIIEDLAWLEWKLSAGPALAGPELKQVEASFQDLRSKFSEFNAPIVVLGPQSVVEAIKAATTALGTDSSGHAQWKLQLAMRRALKIK